MRARLSIGLLVAALFAAQPLSSQFSGPAVSMPTEANRPQTPTTDAALLSPSLNDLPLGSGDLLTIRIFGTTEFVAPVRVTVDGIVQLPLIGPVTLGGLTIIQAEGLIARRLREAGMYVDPQVSIQLSEATGQFATVTGELHALVPLTGSRRLLDVIAAAGGLPITASHTVTILRPGISKPIVIDLGTDPTRSERSNVQVLPRDTILISRVGVVYVLGAFEKQGAIPLQQNSPLTLMQATSLSGGTGFEGKFADLRIMRTVGDDRKLITVDIKRILHGEDPDPVLQADDIVFLPTDALKAAIKSGGIGTVSNILSLLIIAFQNGH